MKSVTLSPTGSSANLPAIPSAVEFQTMKEIAKVSLSSKYLPSSINNLDQALVIMLKGRELRIPPMQAFAGISVIQGKPATGSETMLALIFRDIRGFQINYLQADNQACIIEARRSSSDKWSKFSFTMEDAKVAGLLGKGNWKTYPAAMLRARCISAMARALCPDALMGCSYTPEELGAEVDEDGIVVKVPDEPSEPRDVTESESSSDPSTYIIEIPKYQGATFSEVVEVDGIISGQKVKDLANYYAFTSNFRSHEFLSFRVNCERYFSSLGKLQKFQNLVASEMATITNRASKTEANA